MRYMVVKANFMIRREYVEGVCPAVAGEWIEADQVGLCEIKRLVESGYIQPEPPKPVESTS